MFSFCNIFLSLGNSVKTIQMRNSCLPLLILALLLSACSTVPVDNQVDAAGDAELRYSTRLGSTQPENTPASQEEISTTAHLETTGQHDDIWARIRSKLSINRKLAHPTTRAKLEFYATKQEFLDRVAERAAPYIYYIVEELEKRHMPLDLALLPIVESAYQPFAHSPSRASGIWQFIPSTGKLYGLKQTWWYDGRRDIVAATGAALSYLQKLHQEFNGDWLLALAAYNAGERNVGRAVERSRGAGKTGDFWSLQLTNETLGYVPSLMAVAEIIANPEKYNITLKPIPNQPYFEIIDAGSQIDLATVSQLSGMSMDEIYLLNPGINKWATDPEGPHHLLIPRSKAAAFRQNLAALPEADRIQWQQAEVKHGDTLGAIATRYRTDINTLKQINHLKSNSIRAGHTLLIPASKQPLPQYSLSQDVRSFNKLKPSGDGQRIVYTVKRGDSLWDISLSYGVSIDQLCAWNDLTPQSILKPGRRLTVWANQNAATLPAAALTVKNDTQQHITYTVKAGDSLWQIARRHGVSVEHLQKWNSLDKQGRLNPGQTLDIYIGTPPADV